MQAESRRAPRLRTRPSTLSRDRTPCAHCERATRTTRDGACVECWLPKREDAYPILAPQKPKTEPVLGKGGLDSLLNALTVFLWWR
jgi:hypothetical protein